jgi:hypothetical protein
MIDKFQFAGMHGCLIDGWCTRETAYMVGGALCIKFVVRFHTILDGGEKDDWKENVKVKLSLLWADLYNMKDPLKRKAEIDRLMGELQEKLLPKLKYILVK